MKYFVTAFIFYKKREIKNYKTYLIDKTDTYKKNPWDSEEVRRL